MLRPRRLAALLPLLALLLPASTAAQTTALPPTTAAGHGPQALAIRAEGQGPRAHVSSSGACTPDGGIMLPLPEDVRPFLPGARSADIELADGKRVLRIEIPRDKTDPKAGTWMMLIA